MRQTTLGRKIWYLRQRIIDLELDKHFYEWLGELGEKYGISTDIALILAREKTVRDHVAEVNNWLNGGVLIVKVSNDAVQLLEAVIRGGLAYKKKGEEAHRTAETNEASIKEFDVFSEWPAEQGILTNLWNESSQGYQMTNWNTTADDWLNLRSEAGFKTNNIAVVDILEMNGPWGRFIKHEWHSGLVHRPYELSWQCGEQV